MDGLPDGLPRGVDDPGFTGLHRLEYGLYHGQGAAQLLPVVDALSGEIAGVQKNLTSDDIAGDPTNLPIRAHEILEDALRDHLSGIDDEGAGAAYAETYADTQVDQVVLGELAPLIDARSPGLVATADTQLAALDQALDAAKVDGRWLSLPPPRSPTASRSTPRSARCSRPSPRSPTCSRSRRPRPDGARGYRVRLLTRYPRGSAAGFPARCL